MPRRIWFGLLLTLLLCPASALAAEPPTEPILRLEAGAHTAMIRRVATDAAGRYLVTASDDKTARVWETASGKLLDTLRLPIGAGNEGKLFSVALSPDGSLVACAGWTGDEWDKNMSIYLFNRASGALLRRLTGLENVINHLAFSPDGRYLAASLGGKNGIRLYRTDTWAQIGADRDYGADSYSVDFDADNRLVATSYDGDLRLYRVSNGGLQRTARVKAPHGSQPYAARFSPAGATIAVSYRAGTAVSLLAATDLSPQGAADTAGVSDGNLSSVAWSPDGRTLFAGGTAKKQMDGRWIHYLRAWERGGQGPSRDLDTGVVDTIMDMVPLADGSVALGSGEPALTLLGADGRRRWQVTPPSADFRENSEGFQLAVDGTALSFSFELCGKAPYRLALRERSLLPDSQGSSLRTPLLTAPGLEISDWKNTTSPKRNGQPLTLQQYELSRSLALAPGGSGFALGTAWYLRYFSRAGEELWQQPGPETCWAVNVSADGRVVVAAFGDGTIRWYRVRDGQELMVFFPHADRKRWVLWTPSGYYDASPGGEELIGWHVNRGKDQAADFFPASKFRATYYRPDIIDQVLNTLDEGEAVRVANAAAGRKRQEVAIEKILPPVVSILAPLDSATFNQSELTLRYNVRTPAGAPMTGVKVLIDGRPVVQNRGINLKQKPASAKEENRGIGLKQKAANTDVGSNESLTVTLPERDCEVTLIAENANAASVPATIRLKWVGKAPQQESFVIQPKLYVLAVGVSEYAKPELRLGLAAKDATDFAGALKKQKGLLYRDVVVKLLTDATATRDDVVDGLDWLVKETTSKDVAMLFLAGHGINDPSGIYYYLPQNADLNKLKRTGVPFDEIRNTVAALAGKALFFVDTCHSGNVMGSRRGVADINAVVNELSSAENGAVVFASSTGRQYSLEKEEWGNGAFTKALVEGINGKADYSGKGKITINMLDLYLSERVKELTGGQQTPTTTKPQTIQDFPVAVRN